MAGRDGNVSSGALLHVGTGLIGSSSAVPGGAGAGEGRRGMRRGRELALEGGEAEREGGARRWKYAEYNPQNNRWKCRECKNPFNSLQAVNGHQHVHKRQRKEIHKNLDLNKPPVGDENGDKETA